MPKVIWLGDCDDANPKIRVSFELTIKSRKRSRGRYNPSESFKCPLFFSRIDVVLGSCFFTFWLAFGLEDYELNPCGVARIVKPIDCVWLHKIGDI